MNVFKSKGKKKSILLVIGRAWLCNVHIFYSKGFVRFLDHGYGKEYQISRLWNNSRREILSAF